MKKRILETLERIEWEHSVDILYACESGSRAWDFVSPNSDYDVRFIYVHPVEHYLSVGKHRDVIENPIIDELDVNGWDLRKALGLMRGSNPSLLEWLHSPLVYRADAWFTEAIRQLAISSLDRRALFHHYSSMAGNDWRKILVADEAPLKRYFYVIRTALCALWVAESEANLAMPAMPPVAFGELIGLMVKDEVIRSTIAELLSLKAKAEEKCVIPRVGLLDAYLCKIFERLESMQPEKRESVDDNQFDHLFLTTLRAA